MEPQNEEGTPLPSSYMLILTTGCNPGVEGGWAEVPVPRRDVSLSRSHTGKVERIGYGCSRLTSDHGTSPYVGEIAQARRDGQPGSIPPYGRKCNIPICLT